MDILNICNSRVLTVPYHVYIVGFTVTVLRNDTLAGSLILCLFVIIAVTVQEKHYICVLLDRTGITQV